MDIYIYYLTGFIMIPVVIFAFVCQIKVNSNYKKYGRIRNSRNMTGAEAAYQLLQMNGVTDVRIKRIPGKLTDHYDPRTKEICLSEGVFASNSIAAVGIACHEAGHACQHAQGYVPLKIRNFVIPVTRFGSSLGIPLAVIGIIFSWQPLIYIGIILYFAVALFQHGKFSETLAHERVRLGHPSRRRAFIVFRLRARVCPHARSTIGPAASLAVYARRGHPAVAARTTRGGRTRKARPWTTTPCTPTPAASCAASTSARRSR